MNKDTSCIVEISNGLNKIYNHRFFLYQNGYKFVKRSYGKSFYTKRIFDDTEKERNEYGVVTVSDVEKIADVNIKELVDLCFTNYFQFGACGTEENLRQILKAISPYVVVTGSYAFGNQTESSDIDFYVKPLPEEKINYEAMRVEEDYTRTLIRFFEKCGYKWSSCFVSSFAIDDTFIPLEFSTFYDIDESNFFTVNILGVPMTASKSTHTSDKFLNGQKRYRG